MLLYILIVNIIINHYNIGGLAAPAIVAGAGLLAGVAAGAGVVGVWMASLAERLVHSHREIGAKYEGPDV
jgi:hypothetical protein